jgi:hypothetical protein
MTQHAARRGWTSKNLAARTLKVGAVVGERRRS